jgi:hypothetical protein
MPAFKLALAEDTHGLNQLVSAPSGVACSLTGRVLCLTIVSKLM